MYRNPKRALAVGAGVSAAVAALSVLVSCLSDPREDDADVPTPACDATNFKERLVSDPSSPQSSLRHFVEASLALRAATDEVEGQLTEACNALATELGLPTGPDALTACTPLAKRVAGINATAPAPQAGQAGAAEVRFSPSCPVQPGVLEACLESCGGTNCKDPAKCDSRSRLQKCDGTCTGQCLTTGAEVPCNGSCAGDVPVASAEGVSCLGRCTGACSAIGWTGKCAGACGGTFIGTCAGTCTGVCNTGSGDVPSNLLPDGGVPTGPGGSLPNNAPGNCAGLCQGVCDKGAEGACNGTTCFDPTSPRGLSAIMPFDGACPPSLGGICYPDGVSDGVCRMAAGGGATTVCRGTCTSAIEGAKCDGTCNGECSGTATEFACQGTPNCGQNAQCANACTALAAIGRTCSDSSTIEVHALHDPALLAAWEKLGVRFSKPVQRIDQLRQASGPISNRTYGDFVAIGLRGRYFRSCVEFGAQNVAAANTKLQVVTTVDPTARK